MSYPQQMPPQQYAQGQNVNSQDWQSSFCNCAPCGTCLLGSFCPCILIGRTAARMTHPSLKSSSFCNSSCMTSVFMNCCGIGWVYVSTKRGEIRQRFGISGSGCGDCCAAYWCPCCAIIQHDNEVRRRLEAGPVVQGYAPQTPMKMG